MADRAGRERAGRAAAGRVASADAEVRMTELRASVRQVVEFSLHECDLSPAAFAAKRMREGAAAHKARQSAGAREETAYQAEKSLSADYAAREITLRVTGRADGLLLAADGARIVEEIKLGTAENPLVPAHRAQAAMYGHMLCQKEGLTGVRLRILYVDENGVPVRLYEEEADSARLKGEFEALCAAYCAWAERLLARRRARDASLFGLAFPYGAYRAGQRTFAANVYVAIRERKRLFAQAPTGIGKTMAALYPAALALGEGKCARVLMLTARTTGRKSAMDALAILRAHGARLLAVEIAAKDKVCPMEKRDCRPEVCPYAKGFYDRLPDALAEALTGGDWGRGQLDALARKHTLCPFELALSLAQEADVVVCDYNYVFDPFVAIDALMQGGAALLIDEAHQLAPRVQDNASAAVSVPQLRLVAARGSAWPKAPALRALTAACARWRKRRGRRFASGLERPPEALDAPWHGFGSGGRGAPERRGNGCGGGVYAGGLLALRGGAARCALCRADGGNGKNREDRIVFALRGAGYFGKDEAGTRRGVFFRDARAV
ncbi:MAG: hypothetical protein ACLS6G_06900 [Christensenellales bacterium]